MHNSKGLGKDHHNHKLIYGPPFPPRSTQAAKNAVRVIFKMVKYISAIEEDDKRVVEPRPFLALKSHYESDTLQKESVVELASRAPTYFRPTFSFCFFSYTISGTRKPCRNSTHGTLSSANASGKIFGQ